MTNKELEVAIASVAKALNKLGSSTREVTASMQKFAEAAKVDYEFTTIYGQENIVYTDMTKI